MGRKQKKRKKKRKKNKKKRRYSETATEESENEEYPEEYAEDYPENYPEDYPEEKEQKPAETVTATVDTNGAYHEEPTKPTVVQQPVSEPVTLTPAEYEAWKVQEKQRMREELIKELQQELILPSKGNEGGTSQGNQSQSPDYSAMQYDQSPLTKTPVQEKKLKSFPVEHDA